jgi:hypothetical protein
VDFFCWTIFSNTFLLSFIGRKASWIMKAWGRRAPRDAASSTNRELLGSHQQTHQIMIRTTTKNNRERAKLLVPKRTTKFLITSVFTHEEESSHWELRLLPALPVGY